MVATLGRLAAGVAVLAAGGWGALALAYAGPGGAAGAIFGLAGLAAFAALFSRRARWPAVGAYALLFVGLLAWWSSIEPSNARDWQTDVAVLPEAGIDGDVVTVRNIRNFSYRSEFDYVPAYYDRQFDLNRLEGVDLVAVYWMGPAIAHVFLSFGFAGGEHLAISIETRKEKGEAYSTLKGFFRQYELYYVVADERDVIRLRTNYRRDPPEDVYVYRLRGTNQGARRLFLEYMHQINALRAKPVFYNTLTTNCTTTIWLNSRVNPTHLPFSWKLLASGYVPEYLYEHGRIEGAGDAFAELQRRAYVNRRAQAAGAAADFSQRIRDQQLAAAAGGGEGTQTEQKR
jgi:hypothetical protein